MRKRILVLVAILVIIVGAAAWYYFFNPNCGRNVVGNAIQEMGERFQAFQDEVQVAESTSRISLSGPISNLQAIARDFKGISVPTCLEAVKFNYEQGLDYSIEGFLRFLSQASDSDVQTQFDIATNNLKKANDAIEQIAICAPFCP